jgi:hypothetical protein
LEVADGVGGIRHDGYVMRAARKGLWSFLCRLRYSSLQKDDTLRQGVPWGRIEYDTSNRT